MLRYMRSLLDLGTGNFRDHSLDNFCDALGLVHPLVSILKYSFESLLGPA